MTWGYSHNADHSPTLNLLRCHYTVIIHNVARGITLTNRVEVIKAEGEEDESKWQRTTIYSPSVYPYVWTISPVAHPAVLLYVTSNGWVTCCCYRGTLFSVAIKCPPTWDYKAVAVWLVVRLPFAELISHDSVKGLQVLRNLLDHILYSLCLF